MKDISGNSRILNCSGKVILASTILLILQGLILATEVKSAGAEAAKWDSEDGKSSNKRQRASNRWSIDEQRQREQEYERQMEIARQRREQENLKRRQEYQAVQAEKARIQMQNSIKNQMIINESRAKVQAIQDTGQALGNLLESAVPLIINLMEKGQDSGSVEIDSSAPAPPQEAMPLFDTPLEQLMKVENARDYDETYNVQKSTIDYSHSLFISDENDNNNKAIIDHTNALFGNNRQKSSNSKSNIKEYVNITEEIIEQASEGDDMILSEAAIESINSRINELINDKFKGPMRNLISCLPENIEFKAVVYYNTFINPSTRMITPFSAKENVNNYFDEMVGNESGLYAFLSSDQD